MLNQQINKEQKYLMFLRVFQIILKFLMDNISMKFICLRARMLDSVLSL